MSRDRDTRIRDLVGESLEGAGVELVQVELTGGAGRPVIRVLIDKEGGVSHGDCSRVTRILGDRLDADSGVGLGSYVLEVSSPGIDRPLVKPADYGRFRGETAAIKTRDKIQGRSNHLGVIDQVSEVAVTLLQPDLGPVEIPFENVQHAHLRRDPWQGTGRVSDGKR